MYKAQPQKIQIDVTPNFTGRVLHCFEDGELKSSTPLLDSVHVQTVPAFLEMLEKLGARIIWPDESDDAEGDACSN